MKLNKKQKKLADMLYNTVKAEFPEIEITDYQVSPDDNEHLWINVITDKDEEYQIIDFAVGLQADIHLNCGFRVSIMPQYMPKHSA